MYSMYKNGYQSNNFVFPYQFRICSKSPCLFLLTLFNATEYDPSHDKLNCSRTCGNTSIPFPFGLEPECSANVKFQLNCTSNQPQIGIHRQYQVVNISLDEGLLSVNETYDAFEDVPLFDFLREDTEEYDIWKWAISSATCDMAKNQNHTSYACISANSECTNVTDGDAYIGYRCKCSPGYEGNPYTSRNGSCHGTHTLHL